VDALVEVLVTPVVGAFDAVIAVGLSSWNAADIWIAGFGAVAVRTVVAELVLGLVEAFTSFFRIGVQCAFDVVITDSFLLNAPTLFALISNAV
jgi:hypothetical protein